MYKYIYIQYRERVLRQEIMFTLWFQVHPGILHICYLKEVQDITSTHRCRLLLLSRTVLDRSHSWITSLLRVCFNHLQVLVAIQS